MFRQFMSQDPWPLVVATRPQRVKNFWIIGSILCNDNMISNHTNTKFPSKIYGSKYLNMEYGDSHEWNILECGNSHFQRIGSAVLGGMAAGRGSWP